MEVAVAVAARESAMLLEDPDIGEFVLVIQRDMLGNITAVFHTPGAVPISIETRSLSELADKLGRIKLWKVSY